jgi:hypothetical protein
MKPIQAIGAQSAAQCDMEQLMSKRLWWYDQVVFDATRGHDSKEAA